MLNQSTIDALIERARAGDFIVVGVRYAIRAKDEAASIIAQEDLLSGAYKTISSGAVELDTRKFWRFLGTDANRNQFLQAIDGSVLKLTENIFLVGATHKALLGNQLVGQKLLPWLTHARNKIFNKIYQ